MILIFTEETERLQSMLSMCTDLLKMSNIFIISKERDNGSIKTKYASIVEEESKISIYLGTCFTRHI